MGNYDANGSLLGKERTEGSSVTRVNYRYDLRNRLEKVDADGDGYFTDTGTGPKKGDIHICLIFVNVPFSCPGRHRRKL